ncbi:MAG: hypothetical protein ABI346_00260 [Candidatus Baltobacteraceae bacterium]
MFVDRETFRIRQVTGKAVAQYVVASGRFAAPLTYGEEGRYWLLRDEEVDAAANTLLVHARAQFSVHASDY